MHVEMPAMDEIPHPQDIDTRDIPQLVPAAVLAAFPVAVPVSVPVVA
jgi:hypothetical protein